MDGQLLAYLYMFMHFATGILALIVGWMVGRIRSTGSRTFSLMMLSQALWVLAYAAEAFTLDARVKIFCHQLGWVGALGSAVFWFLFILKFTQIFPRIPLWVNAAVWVIPVISLAIIFTNPWHRLFWADIQAVQPGFNAGLNYIRGSANLLPTAYGHFLAAFAAILLFRSIFYTARPHRKQRWMLLAAVVIPWLISTLFILGILIIDLAPFSFAVLGVVMGWIVFRFQILELTPVGLDVLVENLGYGVLVIDLENRIIDLNPAVTQMTGLTQAAIGYPLAQALKNMPALREACENPQDGTSLVVQERKPRLYLEIKKSTLYNREKRPFGRMVLMSDITTYKKAEEALLESEAKMRLIFDNVNEGISYYRDLPDGRRVLVECNRRYVEMSGFHRATLLELDDTNKMLTGLESPEKIAQNREAQRRGQPYSGVFSWNRPDGKPNIIEYTAVTLTVGEDMFTIGVDTDVTERRAAERALQDSEQRLRTLFELNPDAIILTDTHNLTIVDCNNAAAQMNGYRREELIGKPVAIITPVKIYEQTMTPERMDFMRKEIQEHGVFTLEASHIHRDGHEYPVEASITVINYGGREVYLTIDRDITERKRSQQAEHDQRTLAEALRDSAAALTSTLDLNEVLDRILEQVSRVLPGDSIGILMLEGDLARIVRWRAKEPNLHEDKPIYDINFQIDQTPTLHTLLSTHQPFILSDTRDNPDWVYKSEDGWIRSYVGAPIVSRDKVIGFINVDSATPHFFQAEHAERLMAFANQAAIAIQNARLYSEAQRLAITDPLTGLYNRGHLIKMARTELERARRYNEPLGIIILDIDNFKDVNDTFGHPVGDEVLRALARIFQMSMRSYDAVGRYGGDEFMIILPETDLDQTMMTAERLRELIAALEVMADDQAVRISASLGVANLREIPNPTLDRLIQRADQALYRAKQAGRNRVGD